MEKALTARFDALHRENDGAYYEMASLSKTLFAYCVVSLSLEGGIALDRPLHEYAPECFLSTDPRAKLITARDILKHSAGLKNWESGNDKTICFEPGTAFQYSGEGYAYLQRCMEKASGLSFQALLDRYINGPLGTNIASCFGNIPKGAEFVGPVMQSGPYEPIMNENAAYSAYASARDYAAFLTELFSGGAGGHMLASSVVVNGHIRWCMGFGLIDGRHAFQYGDNGDFQALFIVDAVKRDVWLRLTNTRFGLMEAVGEISDPSVRSAMVEFLKREYGGDFAHLSPE